MKNNNDVLKQLNTLSSKYHSPALNIISMLEPISRALNENEKYSELELLNNIARECYDILKASFFVHENYNLSADETFYVPKRYILHDYFKSLMLSLDITLGDAGFSLKCTNCKGDATFCFDEVLLSRVIFLLFSHCCATSPVGSTITCVLKLSGDTLVITITDESDGLSSSELANLLEQEDFCQDDNLMGLPLAYNIIRFMGGNMVATSREFGGSKIVLTLPNGESSDRELSMKTVSREYLSNRYSDLNILFSGISKKIFY